MFTFNNLTLEIKTLFPAEYGDDDVETMGQLGPVKWRRTETIQLGVPDLETAISELKRLTNSILIGSTGALFVMGEINNISDLQESGSATTIQIRHVEVQDPRMAKWLEEQMKPLSE